MTHEPGTTQEPVNNAETHMGAHAGVSDDDHGHPEVALGPIDWRAWTYALVAAASGVLVVIAFWIGVT